MINWQVFIAVTINFFFFGEEILKTTAVAVSVPALIDVPPLQEKYVFALTSQSFVTNGH